MLIEFENIKKYGIIPTGVIHVGMHKAEEYPIYKAAGVETMLFIEANPRLANQYAPDDPSVHVVNAAVSDLEEVIEFNITNNGESSSILELADHLQIYPHIVNVEKMRMVTRTLDRVIASVSYFATYKEYMKWNILNLDIQGAELKAMKGLTDWTFIEAVFTEVNYREMYKGCALVFEIDAFLDEKGFKKVEEVDTGCGWGDALYIRK